MSYQRKKRKPPTPVRQEYYRRETRRKLYGNSLHLEADYIKVRMGRMASRLLVFNVLYMEKTGQYILPLGIMRALEILENEGLIKPPKRKRRDNGNNL